MWHSKWYKHRQPIASPRRTPRHALTASIGFVTILLIWGFPLHVASGQQGEQTESEPAAAPLSLADSEPETALTPREREERFLKTLEEFHPDQALRIRMLREKNPKEFARMERQMRPWARQLREARSRDPELARLLAERHRLETALRDTETAIRDWQERYRAATPDQREALLPEGRRLAEQRVDLRLHHSRLEILAFEKRLQALKTRLQERESRKPTVIEYEVSKMISAATSQPASDSQE